MRFDLGGVPATPTLGAKFDIAIDFLINAVDAIDEYNVSGAPLSMQSADRFPTPISARINIAVSVGDPSILG
jgi:hypothetical protein